jgi:hypothetical protein
MDETNFNEELNNPENITGFIPSDNNDIENDIEESDGSLLINSRYDIPDNADTFVDTKDGSVVKKEDMTPFQIIKAIAKQNNLNIKDPSKSCKHCYGRGYESIDSATKMPIPCRCLFRGKTDQEKMSEAMYDSKKNTGRISRQQKRKMRKLLLNNYKLQKKFMLNKHGNDKSVDKTEDDINLVLTKYQELKSFKKTAKFLNMTRTNVEKIIKKSKNPPKDIVENLDVKGD